VVNGQTFAQWFKDTYIFDAQGTSPLVSGFYFDDYITNTSFGDPWPHMADDMGITREIQEQLAADYAKNMAPVYDEVLARGMFSWQQLWNGQGSPSEKNGCCIGPLVTKGASCANQLRALCSATSPAQTRAMAYAFSPGRCGTDPGNLVYPEQDIANFLLVRGPYAWLCVPTRTKPARATPPLTHTLPPPPPQIRLGDMAGLGVPGTTKCPPC
jgi:hypothetical protein